MKMLSRILRTRAWDSRNSPGSGRSGSPMRTMSPASAARSLPTPPSAKPTVGRRQGRGIVDPVADHGHAAAPSLIRDSIHRALSAGNRPDSTSSIRPNASATSAGRFRAVAGQQRERVNAGLLQLGEHGPAFFADRIVDSDRPEQPVVDSDQQSWSRPIAPFDPLGRSHFNLRDSIGRIDNDLLRLSSRPRRFPTITRGRQMPLRQCVGPRAQERRADIRDDAGAGMRREIGRRRNDQIPRFGFAHDQARQEVLAAPLRDGRHAEQLRFVQGRQRRRSRRAAVGRGSASPFCRKRSCRLVASRSSATEPFTTTPLRASQAIAAITAVGVARISGHGQATTSTASAGRKPVAPLARLTTASR